MFEGKPLVAHYAHDSASARYADDELIAFDWGDLVARLSAGRELRAALAHVPTTARASFDALAAEHLVVQRKTLASASQAESPDTGVAGKYGVNLVASGNGKDRHANEALDADDVQSVPRGIA